MNLYYEPVIFKEECFMMIFVTLTFIAIFGFYDLADFIIEKCRAKENHENWDRYQQALLDYENGKRKDYPFIEDFFPYGLPKDLAKYSYTKIKK